MTSRIKLPTVAVILLLSPLWAPGCANQGISIEEDARLSPSHPGKLTSEAREDGIQLGWPGTGDDTIQYYQVYRKTADATWQPIAEVKAEGDNRGAYRYEDRGGRSGDSYIYGVSAINGYQKESAITQSLPVVFP